MYCVQKMKDDLYYVGGSDRRLALFENIYPIPRGVSYNAYVVRDEKTVLLDTVDQSVAPLFFENLTHVLGSRGLDYIIVNHMEPDHSATLKETMQRYPFAKVVCNAKTLPMIRQFFGKVDDDRVVIVKEGDELCTGRHTFTFVMAPMVHWPEAMVTFDKTDGVLYSADAFGTFGALSGNLYADEVNFERDWLDDARRYYVNIVGKYGIQVQVLLKKAGTLPITMICPLHGPVWRENLGWFLEKYDRWSRYEPEEKGVVIACASIYGDTELACQILGTMLSERGVKDIALYDLSSTDVSVVLSESFRRSHLVLAASSYNGGVFTPMENLLNDLKAHNFQNRTVAVLENGTWAPSAGKCIRAALEGMKNLQVLDGLTVRSALHDDQLPALEALADAIAASLREEA
ncbi:MAG: FprA family A-type flavoprotein [Clostridia bacterium]|nr:FprA family A-type flavoprotein [Clostridia bacterium]